MVGDVGFFERVAPVYDWVMPRADPTDLDAGLGCARRPVDRVVDLGGGTGRAIREVDATERLVVDPARRMLRRVPSGVGCLRGSGTALPLADASVDAVLIVDALHHMPGATKVLPEVRRVLRPGGVVVILDFDPTTIRGRLLAGAEHLIRFDSTFYSATDLVAAMATAGLDGQVVVGGFSYVVAGTVPGNADREHGRTTRRVPSSD